MSEVLVSLEKAPLLATITVNRLKALNVLSYEVLSAMQQVLGSVSEDNDIR